MSRRAILWWVGVTLPAFGCRTPTQVSVDISTDVDCPLLQGTTVTVGEAARIEGKDPVASTSACSAGADLNPIGSIVVIPSDANDAEFGVKVVAGVDFPAETCTDDNSYQGCIVSRRAMRFVPHEELHLPIALRGSCKDVPCTATTTCVLGTCVNAVVDNPELCVDSGACGEGILTGTGGGGTGGAGGAGGAGGTGGMPPVSECGDGIVDPLNNEQCDDGNLTNDDGCSGNCMYEPTVHGCPTGGARARYHRGHVSGEHQRSDGCIRCLGVLWRIHRARADPHDPTDGERHAEGYGRFVHLHDNALCTDGVYRGASCRPRARVR